MYPAIIRTRDLQNANQERYNNSNLLGVNIRMYIHRDNVLIYL
jgi:hypothetical protein